MKKKVLTAFTVLAVTGCGIGIASGDPFVYLVSYKLFLVAVFLCMALLFAKIALRLASGEVKKKYEGRRSVFDRIMLEAAMFFALLGEFVRWGWLYNTSAFVKTLGDAATLAFAICFLWGFLRGRIRFVMSIAVLVFVSTMLVLKATTWVHFTPGAEVSSGSSINALKTLPYLTWAPAKDNIGRSGVTLCKGKLTFDSFNLYTSLADQEAHLMDMCGDVIHTWSKTTKTSWYHVELCHNGDLLVAVTDTMLMRLDWDSNIKWSREMRAHHDVTVDRNGMIYALAREDGLVFRSGLPVPILSDYIVVLSPDGQIKNKLYVYDLVSKHTSLSDFIGIYKIYGFVRFLPLAVLIQDRLTRDHCFRDGGFYDVLHANSIEILDQNIGGFCRRGDWLISVREIDLIGVVDPAAERFVWTWGPGHLDKQHCPSLLIDGSVLIYDNGPNRGFSRVIELDPLSEEIRWRYRADPPEDFFSGHQGFSQRLPNGNTLITDSLGGHTFEVTREGEIVWEFFNTKIDADGPKRKTLYRMTRIVDPEIIQQIQVRIGQAHN